MRTDCAASSDFDLLEDTRTLSVTDAVKLPHARLLQLEETVGWLASPDSGEILQIDSKVSKLKGSKFEYPIVQGLPILYPDGLLQYFSKENGLRIPPDRKLDSFTQYFLLSQIKQSGEVNVASENIHYQRHLFRMRHFLSNCRGVVLDVGCDNVPISRSIFPENCAYIGLDPFSAHTNTFRLIGVGEFLPFQSATLDGVVFNTSLDHILDYHQALDEAKRVLKPGGSIYLATLVWTSKATLLSDSVHFHHFREYEIFGALNDMHVAQVKRYMYKADSHRYGLFLQVKKPGG